MPENKAMNNTSSTGSKAGCSSEIDIGKDPSSGLFGLDGSDTAGPLVEFHRFPDLPPELRAKIWLFACYAPRVIDVSLPTIDEDIHLLNYFAEEDYGYEQDEAMCLLFDDDTSNTPSRWETPFSTVTARVAPPVLHVSREARQEALQHYNVALGRSVKTSINGATLELSYPAKTYINWKADIICSTDCFDVQAFAGDEGVTIAVMRDLKLLENLTRIAVSLFHLDMTLKRLLPRLAVKDVIVYLDPDMENWSEEQRDYMEECQSTSYSSTNINAKYEVKFIDAQRCLGELSKADNDEDDVIFRPVISKSTLAITRKRVEFIRGELVRNNTKPEWKVPRFEVMALEIREKERYFEHEQERFTRIREAKERST